MRLGELTPNRPRISATPSSAFAVAACLLLGPAGGASAADGPGSQAGGPPSPYRQARALFEKFWFAGEAAPAGGDGLGPLFNERSCVGCHFRGGVGGSGDPTKDVTILAAVPGASAVQGATGILQGELEDFHPGFRNRTSIVLHQHATSEADEARLTRLRDAAFVQARDELFLLGRSRRSTPALFGAGRIEAIPDRALLEAEAASFPAFPEIKGRVSRLRDGRIGKFGWKGQTATLGDFVLAACANELGLEVRGHHQPSLLSGREFDPKALHPDLDDADLARLTWFVANLPAPGFRPVGDAGRGAEVFESIGCASCHAPSLGGVRGLYSDLLLHDLGDRFVGLGGGYGGGSMSPTVDRVAGRGAPPAAPGEAGPTEWRTTPLWGVAASAPYLHDGRAVTLDQAIRLHGGEAEATSRRYAGLSPFDRQALLAFLHSQVAPPQPADPDAPAPRGARRKSR